MHNPTDLTAVIPTPKLLTIAGEDIPIRQIKVGTVPAVLRALQPLSTMLTQRDRPLDIKSLFILYADDCLALLQALSGKPAAWVADLEIDDGIKLFSALFEVNLDFFVQRVLPLLPEVLGHLRTAMENLTVQAGQTASKP